MSNAVQLITRDYNGLTFVFREDGFFNMTTAAKHFEKRLDNFMLLPSTREYAEALAESYSLKISDLIEARRGRNGATFGHPKLAVRFAQWLDTKFAVWCDSVIEDILAGRAEMTITKPEESAVLQASTPDVMLFIQQLAQGIMLQTKEVQEAKSVAAHAVSKVEMLEKDVRFSHNMLTFDEFCASFGIQRKKDGRRSLSSVVAQKMRAKPSRVTTKFYHNHGETSLGSVKTYLEDDLIEMWKNLRKDYRFDDWTYKDTDQF